MLTEQEFKDKYLNKIVLGDSYELIKEIPDKSIDLVIIDPEYEIVAGGGGGCFGTENRAYHNEVSKKLHHGVGNEILEELCRVMKKIYCYIWCNKNQLRQLLNFFHDKNCSMDLLTWHKTNPIPTCNNKYLSDTEYLFVFREEGTKLNGNYDTLKKYYVTSTNKDSKNLFEHPTIKPLEIIKNLIINSSNEGDIVLDFFAGSGTTAVASQELGRQFIGIEWEEKWVKIARDRLDNIDVNGQISLFPR